MLEFLKYSGNVRYVLLVSEPAKTEHKKPKKQYTFLFCNDQSWCCQVDFCWWVCTKQQNNCTGGVAAFRENITEEWHEPTGGPWKQQWCVVSWLKPETFASLPQFTVSISHPTTSFCWQCAVFSLSQFSGWAPTWVTFVEQFSCVARRTNWHMNHLGGSTIHEAPPESTDIWMNSRS